MMSRNNEAQDSRPHVVLLDDEEDLCTLLALRLQHHGFRVSAAHTASQGLALLEREIVDAMIIDVRLDGDGTTKSTNGLDLLVEVQRRALDLPVIVLTAHGSIECAVEAMKRGAYGFLTKPFDNHELMQKLQHAVERIRLRREVANLRSQVDAPPEEARLLGVSAAMTAIRDVIARIAPSDATVLLSGESGTGKEVAARSIHSLSGRRDAPFVAINCGGLPGTLLESELFGHQRGSFTGAIADKPGLFAAAHGGTLFLDEIGDAPPSVQVKLLRVLQERTYTPVGSTSPRGVDVRVIAATNHDIYASVEAGSFREDLFYRLHVVPIVMPALRDRRDDIPILAEWFLRRVRSKHNVPVRHLSSEVLQRLMAHDWPGNIRELSNVVEGGALLCTGDTLQPEHITGLLPRGDDEAQIRLPHPVRLLPSGETLPPMREARETFDRVYLQEVLERSGGNVSAAARLAGRNRTDFYELLRRYGIQAASFR